jgi:MFS family permease
LYGRKRVYIIGSVLTGIYGCIYFALLNTVISFWVTVGIVLSFVPHDLIYGPQAALIAESLTLRLRYSGCSVGDQLSSVISGGPSPLIATALLAWTGSGYAITAYIVFCVFCAVVSIVATALMPDYTNRDISQEHDAPAAVMPTGPGLAREG